MNSEAASETQYEDSKPHFTKYRKDAKIMLRRKLLSVLLALALVVSMAVPALALNDSRTSSGSHEGYQYTCSVSATDTRASGSFAYNNYNVAINCTLRGSIYVEALSGTYYNYGYGSGYGYLTASVGNSVTVSGTVCIDEITGAKLTSYINGTRIKEIFVPEIPEQ